MEFTYMWLHIPTGSIGERTSVFTSEFEFLESLADWNRQGGVRWKYAISFIKGAL